VSTSAPDGALLLEARSVSRLFGGLLALDTVDLAVRRGSVHGLIGPNGAGKTTLLNLIAGVYRVSSGELHYCARDITQYSTGDPQVDAGVAASLPPDQPASTVIVLPAIGAVGAAYHWGAAWTIEADAVYNEWSAFKDIPFYFQNSTSANSRVEENYDNSFQFRFGVENRRPRFTVRAGYYYDQAAAPTESVSPTLPDADRHGGTLGLGMGFGADKRLTLDVYQLAVFIQNRKTDGVNRDGYEGEYKSFASATGLSVAYRW